MRQSCHVKQVYSFTKAAMTVITISTPAAVASVLSVATTVRVLTVVEVQKRLSLYHTNNMH